MTSKEHTKNQEKHKKNEAHDEHNNHTEKNIKDSPFNYLWSSIKTTFIVYIICTIIVAIVLVYCGISFYHAPLLTLGLMLALLAIGYA